MDLDALLVDQTHQIHGKGATYVAPDATETPDITVVFHEPLDERHVDGVDFGRGVSIAVRKTHLLVRVSQVEDPEEGGLFQLDGGAKWRIAESPIIHEGSSDLEWRCACARET